MPSYLLRNLLREHQTPSRAFLKSKQKSNFTAENAEKSIKNLGGLSILCGKYPPWLYFKKAVKLLEGFIDDLFIWDIIALLHL